MRDDFYNKEKYTQEDINELIKNEVEESLNLEFKESRALEKSDKKRNEISKDVSSFANSDGGIIIYGIKEKNHKASSSSFLNGNIFTKEWLEQVINSKIQRRIEGIKIFPIRFDDNIEKSIYIVKIPASYNAPHMASDNKFYKRYNFQSVPMEEYEIRDVINRRQTPKLEIDEITFLFPSHSGGGSRENKPISLNYYLVIQVKNIGHTIENNYKLEISLPSIFFDTNSPISNDIYNINLMKKDKKRLIFAIPNQSPIFQDEITTGCKFPINVNKNNKTEIPNPIMVVKLLYSNGVTSKKFDLLKILKYNGKPLSDVEFTN